MNALKRILASCLLLGSLPNLAQAQNIVVPNALANVGGNTDNGLPFSITAHGLSTERYQQVYDSSQFSAITGPTLISTISFRPDAGIGGAFNTNLPSIQINLSTTNVAPDDLSITFASNVGGNDTQVYSGALALSSTATGGPPRNFDIVITLQTPFLYDPSAGNLLLDVRNFGGGTTTQFDAQDIPGDSVSRVGTFTTGNVGSATADFEDSQGLVTQFTFAAVPEPTTWALLGVVTLATGAYTWNKRRQAINEEFCPYEVASGLGGTEQDQSKNNLWH